MLQANYKLKGGRLFMQVTKSTLSALCIVSPLSTLTLI